jgi:hypothetical protein
MDNNELIIQALREGFKDRLAKMADEYEFNIANLRLQLTHLSNEHEDLKRKHAELQEVVVKPQENTEAATHDMLT